MDDKDIKALANDVSTSSDEAMPADQMRVADNRKGRKKVALAPGHSQLDWLRLHQTMRMPKMRPVTLEELKTHKSQESAWTCIRGLIFDVTEYLEFHPGGVDMLMKAAGRNGTSLFDKYHSWVNIGGMLERCRIGYLAADDD